jgi:2-methylcitrate dehydratase PrpD
MQDPVILALRERIKVVPSDELLNARPRRQAIVEVETHAGLRHSHRIVAVRGTSDNPMDRGEVEAKAHDLIGDLLGRQQSEALIAAIRDLAKVKDMARLRPLWQAPTPRPARAH